MSKNFIILLGAPCAGKSTQSDCLIDKYSIKSISIGRELRKIARTNSQLASAINQGRMASNDIVNQILLNNISMQHKWYLLDGYPRTKEQAHHLTDLFPPQKYNYYIIKLNISYKTLLERMNTRSQCKICDTIYQQQSKICCQQLTAKRIDDNPQAFQQRFDNYQNNITNNLQLLQPSSILEIDGEQSIETISNLISQYLSEFINQKI